MAQTGDHGSHDLNVRSAFLHVLGDLASSLPLIRETLWILLEFTSRGVDYDVVVSDLLSVEGVEDVHHVHIWSLCSEINLFEAHILTTEPDLRNPEDLRHQD